MQTPTTIRGKVDLGILKKADRLFRNDDKGTFIEVLQNARRAAATRVDFTIEQISADPLCMVTVEDNGTGIDNFQDLVTLGRSGWDEETQHTEDPAGMGFFSLCQTGVDVTSRGKMTVLSRDVFLGEADAEVKDDAYVAGTRLRFTRPSTKRALSAVLVEVAEFCPLDVWLNGEALSRHDFLEGAMYREVIDGIEVAFATTFTHNFYLRYDDSNWNFYGAVIRDNFPNLTGILSANHTGRPLTLYARFNVLETGRIKLQLPDRRSVIESEFLTEFKRKATAAAYRCFQQQEKHALSYRDWKEASKLGIELPEASFLLATWSVPARDVDTEPLFERSERKLLSNLDKVLLVESDLPEEHTLQAALHSGAKLDLLSHGEQPEYRGYSWYDQLPRLTDCKVFLDRVPYAECTKEMLAMRPRTIEVEITIEQPGRDSYTVVLPALIHVDTDEDCWFEPTFVAVQGSPWDKGEAGPFSVHDLLMWATFMSSDDSEADSWQTQRDYHEETVDKIICEYFHGTRGSLLSQLRKFVDSAVVYQANKLGITEIKFHRTAQEHWEIEMKRADGTAA